MKTAAGALHDWLSAEHSPLRGLIGLMSSGGVYFTAYCSELTGRAAVHAKGGAIKKEDFVAAAVERLCLNGATADGDVAPALSSGLF